MIYFNKIFFNQKEKSYQRNILTKITILEFLEKIFHKCNKETFQNISADFVKNFNFLRFI